MSDEAYKAFGGNGERGPKGDHGQHGDRGEQGSPGVAGERGNSGLAGLPGERGPVGDTGATGPRGRQGARERSLWPTLRLIAFIFVAVASIFAAARTYVIAKEARDAVAISNRESRDRRDQICQSSEREHLRDVTALRNTYLYLANLSHDEVGSTFNRFIIAQIPQTEEKAHIDVAPDFCDEPGVGLPEPDPVVPNRPPKIEKLIHELAQQHPVIKKSVNQSLSTQRRPH